MKFLEPSSINNWINSFDISSLYLIYNFIFNDKEHAKTIIHNIKSITKARAAVTAVPIALVKRIHPHSLSEHCKLGGWPPVPQKHEITTNIGRPINISKAVDKIFITLWHLLDKFCVLIIES